MLPRHSSSAVPAELEALVLHEASPVSRHGEGVGGDPAQPEASEFGAEGTGAGEWVLQVQVGGEEEAEAAAVAVALELFKLGAVGVVRVDMTGASMAGMVADTLEGDGGNVGDGVEIFVCHGFKCSGCAARRAGLSGSGGVEDITELLPASLGLCINNGTSGRGQSGINTKQ